MGPLLKETIMVEGSEDLNISGDEIVISGVSGLFPSSDSAMEFMENLFNKVDMVTSEDLNFDHPEAPKHMGKISGIRKFDAHFFKVTHNQAVSLEPMCRKLMEHAYMAMYDSGINPLECRGKKIGVYIGTAYMDSGNMSLYSALKKNGFIISGGSKCMLANRISYFLDGKAPSYALDCGCASSLVCLERAYNDIKTGICESAIVGGCQLCLHPLLNLNMKRTEVLCLDGKTKCFDKKGDGYARSEATSLLFLQKAKDAKRIYTQIYHAKVKYCLKPDAAFLPMRRPEEIEAFLNDFYEEAGVSPDVVEYVEANGTAIAEADAYELEAIGKVFGKKNPVMVGCVKSNMGCSEPASGVCGLTKLCLAYHKGQIPANIHYEEPLDIPAVKEGRVNILTEHATFGRGFTAINNFCHNGINCHVLLKGHHKAKDNRRYSSNIPTLILVSGREEKGMNKLFDYLKSRPIDPEVVGLLHNIYKTETPGHTCRGYIVLDTNGDNETISLTESVNLNQGRKRPLWLVFSGMGSQWPGMGKELMRIPIFAAAIERCHNALKPKGIDLLHIITTSDETIFDQILNCFIGIASVQIGLIEIWKAVGVVPDNIIGHSVGEMACAYFDGCFSIEEMILAAYSRGVVSSETKFIKGSMAAVGLGYSEIVGILPPEIDVACHNSSESSTISGPSEIITKFVAELMSKDIFAKEVKSANIAYHSRYISKAGPGFLKKLGEVIKSPVQRSDKWICTSFPPEQWDNPIAKYSSPQYHANNLLSPVYFEEASRMIPKDAVIVEIAPHGLLQAILKRSHRECTHIPLTRRGHSNPVEFLFQQMGKLYQEGYNLQVDTLYPKLEFPVSTETSPIAHFVEWYHDDDWPIALHSARVTVPTPSRQFTMSVQDDDFKFIASHVIEGLITFPESAILFLLWETLAMYNGIPLDKMSVRFYNIQFHVEVTLKPEEALQLNFVINKGNDYFEVSCGNIIVATGYLTMYGVLKIKHDDNLEQCLLYSNDIYNIMNVKGYTLSDEFKLIHSSSINWNYAQVKSTGNWITFLDSLIQLNILSREYEGVSVPKIIKSITINAIDHNNMISNLNQQYFDAHLQKDCGITRCGGVEIKDIIFLDKPIKQQAIDVLETLAFVPHNISAFVNIEDAFNINLQIVAENLSTDDIKVILIDVDKQPKIRQTITSVSKHVPDVNFTMLSSNEELSPASETMFITLNFLKENSQININEDSFILTFEDFKPNIIPNDFICVSSMICDDKYLLLLKKRPPHEDNILFIPVDDDSKFCWVSLLETELQKSRKVVLVSEKQPHSGLYGLVKELRKEFRNKIAVILVEDTHMPSFDPKGDTFMEQIKKNLSFNVLKTGKWGGYYYLKIQMSVDVPTNYKVVNTEIGDLDKLKLEETYGPKTEQNTIQICYAGISLKDAQKAVGILDEETDSFGMDFSGINIHGQRVMGLVKSGALARTIESDPDLLWPVPDHWTLEEAATVPLPYIHAYYCLIYKSHLKKRNSVFITRGSSAFGQAVITIALSMGCEVYTCVSDLDKKQFLIKLFPSLKEKNISSCDSSFFSMVVANSNNKLCDLVINTFSGYQREYAMKCVGVFGYFLDLSVYDMKRNMNFGMRYLENGRSYQVVDLSAIFRSENKNERKMLRKVLSDGIASGVVKPITNITYPADKVSVAFRLLSANKNDGRILINMREVETSKQIKILPRLNLCTEEVIVIICDRTNLGVEVANRLVKRGARNLILQMNPENSSPYLQYKLKLWNKIGVKTKISTEILQTESSCAKFIADANSIGEVHGIFIIKQSLQGVFVQEEFVKIRNGDTTFIANLDLISRNNCHALKNFVVIVRNIRNAVYEYTTSVLEKICQSRYEVGLPSLLFRTGIIEESVEGPYSSFITQNLETALNSLEISIKQKHFSVRTYNLKKKQSNEYLNKISAIIGVKSINEIEDHILLEDILTNESIEELRMFLKHHVNLEYSIEVIKEMTIARLKHLQSRTTKRNTRFDSGLGAFYTLVDMNENRANEVLVPMQSLVSSFSEDEINIDGKAPNLILIPGFEGDHHIYKSICKRLKIHTVAAQLSPGIGDDCIQKMALELKQYIMKRFTLGSKFYLLGYSFGVTVALELAALLEQQGLVGVVFCIDSSPDVLRIQLNAYLGKLSEEQLQNAIIDHFYYLISGEKNEEIVKEIEKYSQWDTKVEKCIQELKGHMSLTSQYARAVINSAYTRINLAVNYESNLKLASELVLLRGIPHPDGETIPPDYNLSRYTKRSVQVYDISSDVVAATEDGRVSNIINRLLDPEILQAFRTKSLCETYVTAPFSIE